MEEESLFIAEICTEFFTSCMSSEIRRNLAVSFDWVCSLPPELYYVGVSGSSNIQLTLVYFDRL